MARRPSQFHDDQPLILLSLWGTSALFRGWRMDYSSSPSRRRHRQATDDGEKDNLFLVSMATGSFFGLHGNPLLRAWRQPSTVHISIVRRRIWGLAMLLRGSDELTMLGKLTMLADQRQTNGCIKPCCEALKRCPTAVVNSAEHWTHWRASDDGEL